GIELPVGRGSKVERFVAEQVVFPVEQALGTMDYGVCLGRPSVAEPGGETRVGCGAPEVDIPCANIPCPDPQTGPFGPHARPLGQAVTKLSWRPPSQGAQHAHRQPRGGRTAFRSAATTADAPASGGMAATSGCGLGSGLRDGDGPSVAGATDRPASRW